MAGSHPNRELQKGWLEYGEADFTIEVLQYLDYDKDGAKTDYQEELALIRPLLWACGWSPDDLGGKTGQGKPGILLGTRFD